MSKYILEFEISGLPKSLNQLLGVHWGTKGRHTTSWQGKVFLACSGKAPDKPLTKARVTATRYSSRAMDYDNLAASFKPILDALVMCGILVDDNPKTIGKPDYFHEPTKVRQGKIKIRVESLTKEQKDEQ